MTKATKKINFFLIVAAVLLLGQFILQIYLAKADAQTTDEGVHLSAGYTYLTKYDFRFNPEHPPLVKILAAAPLLLLNIKTPPDDLYFNRASDYFYDSWREARAYGEDLLYKMGNDADKILLFSRIPMALLTLLLGLTILIISSRLWGLKGGLLSLALFVLEPIVCAHGHLVTTDIGVSLGYLLTIYLLWLFLNKSSWRNVILLGIVLGLAELSKFTAVILLPAMIILLVFFGIAERIKLKEFFIKAGKILIAFIICWLVIWVGYGFKTEQIPQGGTTQLVILNKITSNKLFNTIRPVLIPRDYFKGLSMIIGHTEGGHDSFLLGAHSGTGWWYYFPTVFSAKTTIPTLIIFALSIILVFFRQKNREKGLFFLAAALIFFALAMFSKADLGVRHLLPVYAVLFVVAGTTADFFCKSMLRKSALIAILAWLLLENARIFPYYLSFYNEFYGGSKNGYKVATDSNYDWGQDLKRIKNYLERSHIKNPWVEYTWDSEKALDYYQIQRRPLSDFRLDKKGFLVIDATALNNDPYWALQNYPIYDRITPSVFVYKLNTENNE